jgi:hypothetical protein
MYVNIYAYEYIYLHIYIHTCMYVCVYLHINHTQGQREIDTKNTNNFTLTFNTLFGLHHCSESNILGWGTPHSSVEALPTYILHPHHF